MLPFLDIVAIGAHEFRQGQGRCELGELSRLQTQGSEHQPRPRTLDGMGIEDGTEKEYQHHPEDDEGEHLIVAVIGHQQHET